MTLRRADFMPYGTDSVLYEIYNNQIDERIEKLLKKGWDDEAVTLHESGEIDDETFYRCAEREACKQIKEEIIDGTTNYFF